ncbi:hypothetical protein ABZP36_003413 [Zizania latifolia]
MECTLLRLRKAAAASSSQALTSTPVSSEAPEAKQMRLETEASLEWDEVCTRLAEFTSTAAGRAACGEGRVPVRRSREESERLLEQTAAALLSAPLDSSGVEDLSAVVAAAAGGRLLSVREICGVGRSIPSARGVFDQLRRLSEVTPDGRRHLLPGGIILSSSCSRATYFMEPRDAIRLNNMEVKLSGDERAVELAILGLLTWRIADSQTKIRHLMGKILELDLACARGSYALWINGVRPGSTDRDSVTQLDPNSE